MTAAAGTFVKRRNGCRVQSTEVSCNVRRWGAGNHARGQSTVDLHNEKLYVRQQRGHRGARMGTHARTGVYPSRV